MDENIIVRLESEKVVTSTFRKLTPAKKEKIYRIALKAFSENTYESVNLESISNSAKISKGSLIQYFSLKSNLVNFLCEMILADYIDYFDKYFLNETAVRMIDRIEQFIVYHIEFRNSERSKFDFIQKMIFENEANLSADFVGRLFDMQRLYLEGIVRRGIETNQLRRDINIQSLVWVIHSVFIGILFEYFGGKIVSPKGDFGISLNSRLQIILSGIR